MAKLVLNALLRRHQESVQAEVSEFPDIKVSAFNVTGALSRLREALWRRMRSFKVETTRCHGEPLSPVPLKPTSEDLAVPIVVDDRPACGDLKLTADSQQKLWRGGILVSINQVRR